MKYFPRATTSRARSHVVFSTSWMKSSLTELGKVLLTLLLLLLPGLSPALTNQLIEHPSPYLAMHGDDPVQWQEWGEEALERARKENKLLFISSGYFACTGAM